MAEIRANFTLQGWNANQLRLRVPVIMRAYGAVLGPQLKEEIKTVQFYWPNVTYRYGKINAARTVKKALKIYVQQGYRTGVRVSSPRDIVDSGMFLNSQRVEYPPDKQTVRFTWDPKSEDGYSYAADILQGFRTGFVSSTGRVFPPRDWITPALRKIPFDRFFAAEWQRQAAGNR